MPDIGLVLFDYDTQSDETRDVFTRHLPRKCIEHATAQLIDDKCTSLRDNATKLFERA